MEQVSGQAALKTADQLLGELSGRVGGSNAPTMNRLKKCNYTHQAMIDLIIEHPEYTQNQLAAHFGYTPGWISNIFSSNAFQEMMETRKEEIIDPRIKATIEERFRALVVQSLDKLQDILEKESCPPQVALRALELGAKAMGIGGNAPPPRDTAADRLEKLASRLTALRERSINATIIETLPAAQDGPTLLPAGA